MRQFPLDRGRCWTILLWTIIFSVSAHLFRWVNMGFSGDALLIVQKDTNWQISIGRFMVPLYLLLRGKIVAPLVIALVATFFLTLSIILIARILDLKGKGSLIILCGVLSTYSALTYSYSSFIPWVDAYMLSLFLATLAVFLSVNYGWGWIPAIVLLALSMGLYPCYVQVAAALFLILIIKELLEKDDIARTFREGAKAVLVLLASGVLYYILVKVSQSIMSVAPAHSYNSSLNVGSLAISDLPMLILKAYRKVMGYAAIPETFHPWIVGICHFLVAAIVLVSLVRVLKGKRSWWLVLLSLILLPLAVNFVYILSNAWVTPWMTYSFAMLYVAALVLLEDGDLPWGAYLRGACQVLFLIIIAHAIIFSNQIYLKKNLEEQATLSVMTRVLDRIETTEGYIPGETMVVPVGDLNKSSIQQSGDWGKEWSDVPRSADTRSHFTVSFYGSFINYFRFYLGYPIKIGSQVISSEYASRQEVIDMPSFPRAGCCKMVDDVLVLKLSDDLKGMFPDFNWDYQE